MDPSCSHSGCDIYDGTKEVPSENNENKTDRDTGMVDKESNTQNSRQQIDDIERADFEEENRIIKHCSGMFVDSKITATGHYSGLSSANSSLASSSETISTLSHLASDFSLPGCSKYDDSNTTIKNMIHSPPKPYTLEEPKKEEVFKPDFMQKLLSSNTQEKKEFPKGKMYKAENSLCENEEGCDEGRGGPSGRTSSNASSIGSSASDSTKDFSVPSTSNADKLLGLDTSGKNEPSSSKSPVSSDIVYNYSLHIFTRGFCTSSFKSLRCLMRK